MHPSHDFYYFLIDRDHHSDEEVESCWANFPDTTKKNLLIWRKREIENYFLDPEYLSHSLYIKVSKPELEKKLLSICLKRVYLDIANYVITSLREELKRNWIEHFSKIDDFPDAAVALDKLKNAPQLNSHPNTVRDKLALAEVETRFWKYHRQMLGNAQELEFGSGKWLEMISGKKVLNALISSNCFQVRDREGKPVQSEKKVTEVVKELLSKPDDVLPADFVELRQLIKTRVKST